MTVTAPLPRPTLPSRGRALLLSCALGTTMLAALPGSANAQAFLATPDTVAGNVTYSRGTPGIETVFVNTDTAIINWQPLPEEVPTSAPFLFLPAGNAATFRNGSVNTNFVVLNRILNTRMNLFNGTVLGRLQSNAGAVPGGTILFSSPGGIIVGASALFDVGSLVLTTLNVVDDGSGNFVTPGGGFAFDGGAGFPNSTITTAAGAQVIASATNSYVAMVAPRIVHGGSVNVNGSTAYIAGEQLQMTVNQGLFDIVIDTGSDNPDPITHTGATGGPASTGAGDNHRIYMVAVPKNQAITALLSGDVGFEAAISATVENGAIILSAGYDVFSDDVSFNVASDQDASFLITGGTVTSDLFGYAINDMFAGRTGGGLLEFEQDVSLFGRERARLFASEGGIVTVAGEALVSAARSDDPDPLVIDLTGGEAFAYVEDGGSLSVAGSLTVDASGEGRGGDGGVGAGTGGTARVFADDGAIQISGDLEVRANGTGGDSKYTAAPSGSGTGGTASVEASNQGAVTVSGDLAVEATGRGGKAKYSSTAGAGTGGSAIVAAATESDILVNGGASLDASGSAGDVEDTDGATGTTGRGGSVAVTATGGGAVTVTGPANLLAEGDGSDLSYGSGNVGGNGYGGTIDVAVDGGDLAFGAATSISANGEGGDATDGGLGDGGNVTVAAEDGEIGFAGPVVIEARGIGGDADNEDNFGGNGGNGIGGQIALQARVGGGGSLISGDLISLDASGEGGSGGDGFAGLDPGDGGLGVGGVISAFAESGYGAFGAIGFGALTMLANGVGGSGGDLQPIAPIAPANPPAAGIRRPGGAAVAGTAAGGNGGDGSGGTIFVGTQGSPAGGLDADTTFGDASVEAAGTGGDGGGGADTGGGDGNGGNVFVLAVAGSATFGGTSSFSANGTGGSAPNGGNGTGGNVRLAAEQGQIDLDGDSALSATGVGSDASPAADSSAGPAGGSGRGGRITLIVNDGSIGFGAEADADASGTGGSGSAGGDGTGGAVEVEALEGSVGLGGSPVMLASGTGGASIVAGAGGDGTGGLVEIQALSGASASQVSGGALEIAAEGTGGAGGAGTGGNVTLLAGAGNGTLQFGDVEARAAGLGGDGGSGAGGAGTGGNIDIGVSAEPNAGALDGSATFGRLTLLASARGGAGASGGDGGAATAGAIGLGADGAPIQFGDGSFSADAAGGDAGAGASTPGTAAAGSISLRAAGPGGTLTGGQVSGTANASGASATGNAAGVWTINVDNSEMRFAGLDLGASAQGAFFARQTARINLLAGILDIQGDGSLANVGDIEVGAQGTGTLTGGDIFFGTARQLAILHNDRGVNAWTIDVRSFEVDSQNFGATAGTATRASDSIDITASETAAVADRLIAPEIEIESGDIDLAATAAVGAEATNSVTLRALANGQQVVLGGSAEGPGYTLNDAEADRITAATLTVQSSQIGTDPSRAADVLVRDLSLAGMGAPGGRIGALELRTPGIARVEGALLLANANSDGSIFLQASQRLEVANPGGSVRVRDPSGFTAGSLTIESNNIWSASQSLLDQLRADPNFAGRNEALLANGGPVEPRGYIEAGDVTLRARNTIFVQNSGTAEEFGGITVVENTLRITPLGQQPLIVYAFGKRINADGSFVTNSDFFQEVAFGPGNGVAGYTAESEFNRCIIVTRACPAAPPLEEQIPQIPGGRDPVDGPVGGSDAIQLPPREGDELVDTSFADDPLIEEPVTSGGDSTVWAQDIADCDLDDDGDCDDDDREQ